MKFSLSEYFSGSVTREQAKDSGMALVLILLIIGLITENTVFFSLAAGFLLINMIFPKFFYPFAVLWIGFSEILGLISSKILLSLIYLVIVLPVALLRRLMRKDSLLLNKFNKSDKSVFQPRDHIYKEDDLEKPF